MENAIALIESADILCVIGTSLNVYPAAGLLDYASKDIDIYLIDPYPPKRLGRQIQVIAEKASSGVEKLIQRITDVTE